MNDVLPPPSAAPHLSSQTVLIIDDTPSNLRVLVDCLEEAGFRVLVAQDGTEGLQRAQFMRPDIILLDIMMPGMDGFETCRRLKGSADTNQIPVVFMTALSDLSSKVTGFEAGGIDYVTKPFQVEEVLMRINTHLALRALQKQMLEQNMMLQLEIVERRLAEDALEQQHAFLRQVIDINPHFIFAKDRDGRYTLVNQALADAFHTTVDAFIGKTDAEMKPDAQQAENFRRDDLEVLHSLCEKVIPEEPITDPEGRQHWLYTVKRPILGKDGRAHQVLGVATDITARKQAEAQLERSNRELEAFAYSVAHDLRSPLRSIVGYSEMLLRESAAQLDPQGLDCAQRIRAASRQLEQLIEAMLSLSRTGRGELHHEAVNVSALAGEIVERLRRVEPERTVEISIAPNMLVQSDASLIGMVLDNLLGNAWKYTGKTAQAMISLAVQQQAGGLVYCVRDNGAGFDMAYADKLFVPFQRLHGSTEFEGTGIGLAIVRRAIERLGGKVWLESAVNQGTCAYISFPDYG